ncbi:hypothetical protein Trco_006194 [Trichoderma cornu-damae]|uniref:Uncharacterized protein n=1 Tax=Trichoderma cornu-damae TaxID=654480 RepID=A0A9P8QL03_9HYPO|nr:hypothetical protein Trco_006194 [Trichoderma cornu-damae]
MLDMERGPGRNGEVGHGDGANSKMTNFKEELERIVEEHTQALNDIEEEYKEEVQHQTMKMMQAMLVD